MARREQLGGGRADLFLLPQGDKGKGRDLYRIIHGPRPTKEFARNAVQSVFHDHTDESDGVVSPEQRLEQYAEAGIHTVFVTDHDTIAGAVRMRDLADKLRYPVDVRVGIEGTTLITSPDGKQRDVHAIGLDVESPLPCYMPVEVFNAAVHEQGGVTMLPHVGLGPSFSLSVPEARRIQRLQDPAARFDLLEGYNHGAELVRLFKPLLRGRVPNPDSNIQAASLYREDPGLFQGIVGTGDHHTSKGLRAVVNLSPEGVDPLKVALNNELQIAVRSRLSWPGLRETMEVQRRSAALEEDRRDPHRAAARGISLYEPARKTA